MYVTKNGPNLIMYLICAYLTIVFNYSPPTPDIHAQDDSEETNKKWRKLDINDLLAGIMVRIRKSNESSLDIEQKTSSNSNTGTPNTISNSHTCPTSTAVDNSRRETSFYYKESSLSSKESASKKAKGQNGDGGLLQDVAVQVHNDKNESSSNSR